MTRRASLTSGTMLGNSSRAVHRSTDSSISIANTSVTLTPTMMMTAVYPPPVVAANPIHEKAVHALITRLKNKLPCHSGLSLAAVESDESLHQTVQSLVQLAKIKINVIAMAMTELLEKLAKLNDPGLDVFQSELYVLKVLSAALNYQWNSFVDLSNQSVPGSPSSPTTPHPLKQKESAGSFILKEPPPLDEAVAKYTLSVMSLFLRQTASAADKPKASGHIHSNTFVDPETLDTNFTSPQPLVHTPTVLAPSTLHRRRPASATLLRRKPSLVSLNSSTPPPGASIVFRAPIGIAATAATLVSSAPSINSLISKYAARIVFHLSAANWSVVFAKIRSRIHSAANPSEDQADHLDIKLLSYCALDRPRLIQVFQELSSLLVNMKRETQHTVASSIRTAVWNWIDVFQTEFIDVINSQRKLEGAPERVFDMFYQLQFTEPANKGVLWPTLTVLLAISPERLLQAEEAMSGGGGAPKTGRRYFLEILSKAMSAPPKQYELAMVCYVDLCKAAIQIPPTLNDTALLSLAPDLADDLRRRLMNPPLPLRPFYESPDPIDIAFIADVLVAIFRFKPKEAAESIFPACLAPERSEAVKTSAVRALYTLTSDSNRLPHQPPIQILYAPLVPRLRSAYQSAALRRPEIDGDGKTVKASKTPTAKRYSPDTYSERDYLVLSIAALWRINTHFFLTESQTLEEHDQFATALTHALKPPGNDKAVFTTTANAAFDIISTIFSLPREHPLFMSGMNYALTTIPATLSTAAVSTIEFRDDYDSLRTHQKIMHSVLHDYCEDSQSEESRAWKLSPRRGSAFGLAMLSLLITLPSSQTDVSFSAATCLRYLAVAHRMEGAPNADFLTFEEELKYLPAFEQIGDPKVRMIGRNAHQKRIRKIIRTVAFPSSISLAVWEECYRRWHFLTAMFSTSAEEGDMSRNSARLMSNLGSEDANAEWKNLTLFLATFAGVCVCENDAIEPLTAYFPPHLLPPRFHTRSSPTEMVSNYIHAVVDLLMADSIFAREVAKEAIGSELNPRLYPPLFHRLDDLISSIFGAVEPPTWEDHVIIFVEQCISVLRLLFDRLENATETAHISVDISRIVLYLAGYIHRSSTGLTSLRIKIQFCGLCESVFRKRDLLALRKEALARNTLLDHLVDWVFAPVPVLSNKEAFVRLQNEVDFTCLKTVVLLLERLTLQPLDGSTGADSSLAVSRLSNKYLNFFVRALEQCIVQESPDRPTGQGHDAFEDRVASKDRALVRELAITGITNMLSANTDAGLKHCLKLGYADDPRLRTTFSVIFTKVLNQGVKFGAPEPPIPVLRRSKLCDMLRADIGLALAVCETCPVAHVEVMIPVMMHIFDTRGSLLELLKAVIEREVAQTETETALFRRNTMCTRLLSTFAKIHGYNYLRTILVPLIKQISDQPPHISFELDPRMAGPKEDLVTNAENLKLIAQAFLDVICNSIDILPRIFTDVCHYIATTVLNIWPESKFAAIGAFIFLRFINPAIVAPDSVDIETPPDKNVRRVLLLITKIIQNLANNVMFGKELHMVALNAFLNENIHQVTKFLDQITVLAPEQPAEEDDEQWVGSPYDEADSMILHRFFIDHADKVGKELLSFSRHTDQDTTQGGKRTWDLLCATLVEMGPPMGLPRTPKADAAHHAAYLDFVHRNGHRNTDSVRSIFVETNTPRDTGTGQDRPSVFIFALSKLNIETVDLDLLMTHIFQTILTPDLESRPFDVIVDCTGFSSLSELPMQWVKLFIDLTPAELLRRFSTAYILNPNMLAQKFLRKLYHACAGLTLATRAVAKATVSDLLTNLHSASVKPLEYAATLENEDQQMFEQVIQVRQHTRMQVVLYVGTNHLRIQSAKVQQIWPGMECLLTEVLSLDSVGDVYNVSTGQDVNEFIIRRSNYGGTIYFSSAARDTIVKTIRKAKGEFKTEKPPPAMERAHTFRDISATLLNIALLNIGQDDEYLRGAAYDLMCSICGYLGYEDTLIVPSRGGYIPANPLAFANHISERLATFAPQITLDFLAEFIVGFDKSSPAQKAVCLQNLSPWIKNLSSFSNPASSYYEHSAAKLRDGIRLLIDITIKDQDVYPVVQRCVWAELAKLDSGSVNIALDEIVRAAIDGGIGSRRCELMADTLVVLSSINVRGRILHKLRKVLAKTSVKPELDLVNNAAWNEVAALTRLALVVCYNTRVPAQNQMFVPEIAHLVTLLASTGHLLMRTTVHNIAMNLIQCLYVARADDPVIAQALRDLMDEAVSENMLRYFGLARLGGNGEYILVEMAGDPTSVLIQSIEAITTFMLNIVMTGASHSSGSNLTNVWRARWMALVTSTSFQLSPYVQARAFIVLGSLATSDVDDDLLYQMLVAFKGSFMQQNEIDTTTVVSMLRCVCKVIPGLPENSRYLLQMAWLAIAMIQSCYLPFFAESARLLQATLETLHKQGVIHHDNMIAVLMEGRQTLDHVSSQLDKRLNLNFRTSFSFSLASIVFKGLRHPATADAAQSLLRSLLRLSRPPPPPADTILPIQTVDPDALGYFLALLPCSTTSESYRRLLEEAGIETGWLPEASSDSPDEEEGVPRVALDLLGMTEGSLPLLTSSFVAAILTGSSGDAEREMLFTLLAETATMYPDIVTLTYDSIQDRVNDAFANSLNSSILSAVSTIFRSVLADPQTGAHANGSASTLGTIGEHGVHGPGKNHLAALEELGMDGLVNPHQFLPFNRGVGTKVIQLMIELVDEIIA